MSLTSIGVLGVIHSPTVWVDFRLHCFSCADFGRIDRPMHVLECRLAEAPYIDSYHPRPDRDQEILPPSRRLCRGYEHKPNHERLDGIEITRPKSRLVDLVQDKAAAIKGSDQHDDGGIHHTYSCRTFDPFEYAENERPCDGNDAEHETDPVLMVGLSSNSHEQ